MRSLIWLSPPPESSLRLCMPFYSLSLWFIGFIILKKYRKHEIYLKIMKIMTGTNVNYWREMYQVITRTFFTSFTSFSFHYMPSLDSLPKCTQSLQKCDQIGSFIMPHISGEEKCWWIALVYLQLKYQFIKFLGLGILRQHFHGEMKGAEASKRIYCLELWRRINKIQIFVQLVISVMWFHYITRTFCNVSPT